MLLSYLRSLGLQLLLLLGLRNTQLVVTLAEPSEPTFTEEQFLALSDDVRGGVPYESALSTLRAIQRIWASNVDAEANLETLYRAGALRRGRSGGRTIAALQSLGMINLDRWEEIRQPRNKKTKQSETGKETLEGPYLEPRMKAEAVVFMAPHNMEKCHALRVRALLESSGGRDVVVLFDSLHPLSLPLIFIALGPTPSRMSDMALQHPGEAPGFGANGPDEGLLIAEDSSKRRFYAFKCYENGKYSCDKNSSSSSSNNNGVGNGASGNRFRLVHYYLASGMKNLNSEGALLLAERPSALSCLNTFGDPRSGGSKAEVLHWLALPGNAYESAWILEEDAAFTGTWTSLFDTFRPIRNGGAHLVAKQTTQGPSWGFWRRCDIGSTAKAPPRQGRRSLLSSPSSPPQSQKSSDPYASFYTSTAPSSAMASASSCLRSSSRLTVAWPVIRLSRRIAAATIRRFCPSHDIYGSSVPYIAPAGGHHEAIVGTLCRTAFRAWCTFESIAAVDPRNQLERTGWWEEGSFSLGGWGPFAIEGLVARSSTLEGLASQARRLKRTRLFYQTDWPLSEKTGISHPLEVIRFVPITTSSSSSMSLSFKAASVIPRTVNNDEECEKLCISQSHKDLHLLMSTTISSCAAFVYNYKSKVCSLRSRTANQSSVIEGIVRETELRYDSPSTVYGVVQDFGDAALLRDSAGIMQIDEAQKAEVPLGQLFHPAKCEFDEHLGRKLLDFERAGKLLGRFVVVTDNVKHLPKKISDSGE